MRSSYVAPLSLLLAFGLLIGSGTRGWCASDDSASQVVAVVGDHQITRGDLEKKSPNDYAKAKSNLLNAQFGYYSAERSVLEKAIDDQLLANEAKKQGITVDELLKRETEAKFKEPSEDTLRIYYLATHTKTPYPEVRGKIIETIKSLEVAKAKDDYMASLRKKNPPRITLFPPREEVAVGDTPADGPADAPVTIVEFADYQCPYCRQMEPDVSKMREKFNGKVRYSFRDFPLPMHQFAQKAAEASRCAAKQNKYWEFHKRLFTGDANKDLAVPQMKQIAREMKLDGDQFDKCLDSGEEAAAVAKDLEQGKDLGISGTPTIFINGYVFSGAGSIETMEGIVQSQIEAAKANAASSRAVPKPQAKADSVAPVSNSATANTDGHAKADCDVSSAENLEIGGRRHRADQQCRL